jgi:hypothetical protein
MTLAQVVLGQKTSANSSSVVIANDQSSIPVTAGANSGVDIGDVTLTAGTNLVGKVGIDQTSANANEVVVKSITAGTNLIGKVSIDQVTTSANRVVSQSYLESIAEGDISGHVPWTKIGWNPAITTSFEDIWSYSTLYVFPPSPAVKMQLASDNAAADGDIGTILYNATCDVGGSTTTLLDATYDWSAGTAAAGDILIIEKSGTTPEWGVITAVANGVLTFSGGLSSGGSCVTARTYQVLDASASTNAMAVIVDFLDSTYASKTEIMILAATTQVESINAMLRINGFRVIAVGTKAGATYVPLGNLALRATGVGGTFYSYITLGFTRARNAMYTVPLGKTLYVNQWNVGAVCNNDTKIVGCRVMTMANLEPTSKFPSGNIFYVYTELLVVNQQTQVNFPIPTKLPAKTDIKVRAIGLTGFSGPVTSVLRGWLE